MFFEEHSRKKTEEDVVSTTSIALGLIQNCIVIFHGFEHDDVLFRIANFENDGSQSDRFYYISLIYRRKKG